MNSPVAILLGGAVVILWITLLFGLIEELKTGVSKAQGRYREVRRDQEPAAYWVRVSISAFGLMVLSVFLFGMLAGNIGYLKQ